MSSNTGKRISALRWKFQMDVPTQGARDVMGIKESSRKQTKTLDKFIDMYIDATRQSMSVMGCDTNQIETALAVLRKALESADMPQDHQ